MKKIPLRAAALPRLHADSLSDARRSNFKQTTIWWKRRDTVSSICVNLVPLGRKIRRRTTCIGLSRRNVATRHANILTSIPQTPTMAQAEGNVAEPNGSQRTQAHRAANEQSSRTAAVLSAQIGKAQRVCEQRTLVTPPSFLPKLLRRTYIKVATDGRTRQRSGFPFYALHFCTALHRRITNERLLNLDPVHELSRLAYDTKAVTVRWMRRGKWR